MADKGFLTILWMMAGFFFIAIADVMNSITFLLFAVSLSLGVPFYYWVIEPINEIANSVANESIKDSIELEGDDG